MTPIITLLTDFGLTDEYVGVMKGVILGICPQARIVDISHAIAAQDIGAAAHMLQATVGYFPAGTVHMVVVDPGVGSRRRLVAGAIGGQFVVGPDNGALWPLLASFQVQRVYQLRQSRYFLPEISHTFHGRDIMAPVSAHIARGVPLARLGPEMPIDKLVRVDPAEVSIAAHEIRGQIIGSDHFGNLLTNIDQQQLRLMAGGAAPLLRITLNGQVVCGLSAAYAAKPPGTAVALIGSRGRLEIAVNQGRACDFFGAVAGDALTVHMSAEASNRRK